jgi:hypothetical protein
VLKPRQQMATQLAHYLPLSRRQVVLTEGHPQVRYPREAYHPYERGQHHYEREL